MIDADVIGERVERTSMNVVKTPVIISTAAVYGSATASHAELAGRREFA